MALYIPIPSSSFLCEREIVRFSQRAGIVGVHLPELVCNCALILQAQCAFLAPLHWEHAKTPLALCTSRTRDVMVPAARGWPGGSGIVTRRSYVLTFAVLVSLVVCSVRMIFHFLCNSMGTIEVNMAWVLSSGARSSSSHCLIHRLLIARKSASQIEDGALTSRFQDQTDTHFVGPARIWTWTQK